jgi:hypothetical protein
MSYLDVDNPKLLDDLSKRKEFYIYNIDPYRENRFNIFEYTQSNSKYILEELFKKEIYLDPHSYQHTMRNFFSPNTPYTRLLAKWGTGSGKTPFSLMIALEFIQQFVNKGKGKVFVLGFNENIFKKELLKFPEFGFITRGEIDELSKLTTKAKSGNERDLSSWQEYISLLKRRITSGKGNGLFQFYGYKAFVNRLFVLEDSDLDINTMNEESIRKAVQDGSMKINIELLESFKDSLVICDEIHNTYNSLEKNNWGIAIQVVLDHYPKIKAVFLSATPMNNSPTEIVDLLNLLIPNKIKFKKSDLFDGNVLKKGAEEKIRSLLRGRISFIQDTNPRYFPSQTIVGQKIPGINYLKFNRAPMSKFHFGVYKKVYTGTLSQDSQYLIDIALPDPTGETPGLYQTGSIMRKIATAPDSWKKKYGIDYHENIGLTGDFMKLENIGKYSAKFHLLLSDIMKLLSEGIDHGKFFIYHNVVHISGVLFIQEMLRINGILTATQEPIDSTPCSVCGKPKKAHKMKSDVAIEKVESKEEDNNKKGGAKKVSITNPKKSGLINDHEFDPVRLLSVHSDIDKSEVEKNIERYNIDDNIEGRYYKFLIGSRLIKEAYSFEGVRYSFIVGRPDNIPTFIQVLGRGKRKKSHSKLPEDKRKNEVRIYTSALPGMKLSHEEVKYKEKMADYLIIQKIEKIMHEVAVDAVISRPLIERGLREENMDLYLLPYKPEAKISNINVNTLINSTYESFYFHREIKFITFMIKRIFVEVGSVFKYDELWRLIREPHHNTEFLTEMFDESYFMIALNNLTYDSHDEDYRFPYISKVDKNATVLDILRNSIDRRIIFPNGQKNFISYIDGYYILLPWVDKVEFRDVEYPYRNIQFKVIDSNIKVGKYIKNISSESNYDIRKVHFKNQYASVEMSKMSNILGFYNVNFHVRFLEETIKYIFQTWVYPTEVIQSEYHEFYFKILYYYDILGVIIWASTSREYIVKAYSKYIHAFDSSKNNINRLELELSKSTTSDTIKHKDALKKNRILWVPPEIKMKYKTSLKLSLALMSKSSKKKNSSKKKTPESTDDTVQYLDKSIVKADATKLPIGHFLQNVPRFFHPDKDWYDAPEYTYKGTQFKENELIVGYHEKSPSGFNITFKLRSPIHKIIRHDDIRKIEKGSICSTYSKVFLMELLKNLGEKSDVNYNVPTLCQQIESKLLYNELQERKKGTNIKYFYSFWEPRPDQNTNNPIVQEELEQQGDESTKTGGTNVYYQDRNEKWKFYTNDKGTKMLKDIAKLNEKIFDIPEYKKLSNEEIEQGEKIYSEKPNMKEKGITWSQDEYDQIGFQRAYIKLKSVQRFTEGYSMFQRAYNAGLLFSPDNKDTVRVVSLGGGPGFELLAFKKFYKEIYGNKTELISMDLSKSWKSSAEIVVDKFYQMNLSDTTADAIVEKSGPIDYIVISYVFYHYMNNDESIDLLTSLIVDHNVKGIFINSRVKHIPQLTKFDESKLEVHSLIDNRQVMITLKGLEQVIDTEEIVFPNVPYED